MSGARSALLLAALAWIGWFDPVPPWRGTGAVALAAAALWASGPLAVGLTAAAVAPMVFAAFRAADPWGLGVLAVAALPGLRERGRAEIAAAVAAIGAMEVGRQLVALEELPAAILGFRVIASLGATAVLALGLPEGRSAAGIAALAGAWCALQAPRLARDASTLPLPEAALEAENRQSAVAWSAVEARLGTASAGDVAAAVRAAPTRLIPGEILASRFGIFAAVDAGWTPAAAVRPELASPLASALVDRGRLQEARATVTRVKTPETAFLRSVIADLQSDGAGAARAWAEAAVPVGVPVGPGVIWQTSDRSSNFDERALFALRAPVSGIEVDASGEMCEGSPVLEVRVGSRTAARVPIGQGPGWVPVALPAGADRLAIAWRNDRAEDGCDRNITSAALVAR